LDQSPDARPSARWASPHRAGPCHEELSLCKVYGRKIGAPTLKPHDLRHGVAMEVLEQRNNVEEVRALLDHTRLDTTNIYTTIRPKQLKRAVAFFDEAAERLLEDMPGASGLDSE
jgi:integrase